MKRIILYYLVSRKGEPAIVNCHRNKELLVNVKTSNDGLEDDENHDMIVVTQVMGKKVFGRTKFLEMLGQYFTPSLYNEIVGNENN